MRAFRDPKTTLLLKPCRTRQFGVTIKHFRPSLSSFFVSPLYYPGLILVTV